MPHGAFLLEISKPRIHNTTRYKLRCRNTIIPYLYVDKLTATLQRCSWTKIQANNSNKLGKIPHLISDVKSLRPEVFAPYSITLKSREVFRDFNIVMKT